MGKVLFVLLLALVFQTALAVPTTIGGAGTTSVGRTDFLVPSKLRPRVDFWKDIFAKYVKQQAVIHHREFPDLVFDVLDFRYPPNYEDYNDGTITTKFLEELNTDEKKLRYYWICYTSLHFNKKLMTDKNFRKDLQKHFHGKSLTHEQENIIFRSMASLILSDPVDELRTALIETSRENLDFFNKLLKRIDHVKLK